MESMILPLCLVLLLLKFRVIYLCSKVLLLIQIWISLLLFKSPPRQNHCIKRKPNPLTPTDENYMINFPIVYTIHTFHLLYITLIFLIVFFVELADGSVLILYGLWYKLIFLFPISYKKLNKIKCSADIMTHESKSILFLSIQKFHI